MSGLLALLFSSTATTLATIGATTAFISVMLLLLSSVSGHQTNDTAHKGLGEQISTLRIETRDGFETLRTETRDDVEMLRTETRDGFDKLSEQLAGIAADRNTDN